MNENIRTLRNRHIGQTAWIVASGPTLNFISPSFFQDKLTIVINEAFREFPSTYVFAHHREASGEAIGLGLTTVVSDYCRCDVADGPNVFDGSYFSYHHPQQPDTLRMDMQPLIDDLDDTLIVGSNTVTSALDFAGRILGASTLILCGVDSGSIDGQWNYAGYNGSGKTVRYDNGEECGTVGGTGLPHIRAQVALIATVVAALRARGVGVYSLNPFTDFGLENHVFAR
jgi:hypothetical protein